MAVFDKVTLEVQERMEEISLILMRHENKDTSPTTLVVNWDDTWYNFYCYDYMNHVGYYKFELCMYLKLCKAVFYNTAYRINST